MQKLNKYAAEAIGTFALVFAGCGAIVINDISGGAVTHIGISLVFGLAVTAMIYSIGNVSGAHINPAVTIGFCAARRFPIREACLYIASQMGGAFAAVGILRLLFPSHNTLGATLPFGPWHQAFFLEVALTFLLMFVILNVSTGSKEKGLMAGVAVGGVVAMAALFAGPISGASMNPARSLAPALLSGHTCYIWVYILAPLIGALAAAPTCRMIQGKDCCQDSSES